MTEARRPAEPTRAGDPGASGLLVHGDADAAAARWSLLGLPYDSGIPTRPGARFGPDALRRALATFVADDGAGRPLRLRDLGNLELPAMHGGEAHAAIEAAAARLLGGPGPIVFVGGDHGCTGSIVRGLATARPDLRLGLIAIDAHLDVREYPDAAHLSSGTPFRRALETEILAGERIAMIGIRPFANSSAHLRWALDRGIHLFGMEEIERQGAEAVAGAALTSIGDCDALYLSVDLDAADGAFAPGVSAVGTGGLTSREMITLVGAVARDPRLIGCDLMELSPPYDQDDRTARLAARLLLEVVRTNRST